MEVFTWKLTMVKKENRNKKIQKDQNDDLVHLAFVFFNDAKNASTLP